MLAERITMEGIITEEEKEVFLYGLESLGGNLLSIILTLAVGACFRQIRDAILVWLFLFPLRKNAGGFHAETKIGCLFLSTAMLILSFAIYTVIISKIAFYSISTFAAGMIIWFLVPIENPVKRLENIEHSVYRRRSRFLLVAEEGIFLLAWVFRWKTVMGSIAMVFFTVGISLVMGWLKAMK